MQGIMEITPTPNLVHSFWLVRDEVRIGAFLTEIYGSLSVFISRISLER